MANAKPLEIFKTGRHTAVSGVALNFSEADLEATARAYDPATHEAPIVVGHPAMDAPAYGWVSAVAYADGALSATPDQVDPAFAELVAAGRYKKISASFYAPDAPANPVPGVYYLRHVGFLGAQPPAVKGLRTPAFADGEAGVIEFGEWDDQVNAGLWRRLREWLIGQFGQDTADKVIPGYDVGTLEEFARQESAAETQPLPAFSESNTPPSDNVGPAVGAPAAGGDDAPPTKSLTQEQPMATLTPEELAAQEADLKRRQQELEAQSAQFAEREAKLATQEKAAKRQGVVEFVEGLVKAGKVLSRDKAGLVEYMSADDMAQVLEFGEGEAKTKVGGDAWLRGFLSNLPKAIEFGELAGGDGKGDASASDQQIANRARVYKQQQDAAGNHISFAEAVDAVRAGQDQAR